LKAKKLAKDATNFSAQTLDFN